MTSAERLQPHIATAYRTWNGKALAAPLDLRAAFVEPADLTYAKDEIARLRAPGKNRTLAEHDHESKIRCQTLERMVQEYEALQNEMKSV